MADKKFTVTLQASLDFEVRARSSVKAEEKALDELESYLESVEGYDIYRLFKVNEIKESNS